MYVFSLISGLLYMFNFHLPQGVLKNPHIQMWSSPKSSPYGFSCDYQHVNTLPSNVARFKYMIHYLLHVKALLSRKQIIANHTHYFWPCLKCSLLPTSLSLPFYLSFLLCIQTRWFFILISQIQISSEEIKAQLVRR